MECLPDILDRLKGSGGESQLAKARMVCSHWSKAALGTVTSWDMVFEDRDSRMFGALQHFSSLKELTIFINNSGFAESFNELISAACSLPNLKTLNLCYEGCQSQYSTMVTALMPLLPRLETLKFSAYNTCENNKAPDASALTQALAAASNLTDLDLSVLNSGRDSYIPNIGVPRVPVEALAALPSTLTRLRIDNVAFGHGQGLQTLCCLPHLEELWVAGEWSGAGCSFDGDMGLRFATSLKSLTCCFDVELKESDLEDILTLQGLRHLRLSSNITPSFVRRLPSRMPSLVSLSLCGWQRITDTGIEALGSLTGLTSLGILAHYNTEIMMAPESLRHLSTLTLLQSLELHNHNARRFLDLGLPHLHALPALKSLDLTGTPVDSAEVMKLLPPALEHISLSRCFTDENISSDVVSSAMRELQKQCRNLVSIDLSDNLGMGIINGLSHLSSLQQLHQVIINDVDDEYDAGESSEWLTHLPTNIRRLIPMLSVIRKTRNSAMPLHLQWDVREREDTTSWLFDDAEDVVRRCRELCQEWEASKATK